jgi:hypothetical protein
VIGCLELSGEGPALRYMLLSQWMMQSLGGGVSVYLSVNRQRQNSKLVREESVTNVFSVQLE